ncbi:hypothetical protein AHX05_08410 [Salmonella enterica subsp. indica]|uniref:Uncharacterized protein n=3 Tax=Salmonella enterica TaxID=28901 RepID=A0A5Y2QRF1_SALER|nr:hypothetical protein [Salmonella enterica]EBH9038651.1 hypothetical protein [Salmonella enterica subsp. indica serovar 11:b:e,n,x]EBP3213139.1 hypothetical protein [Salmonella enterica subsp. arizonae]ECI8271124.1 hypothetical protein [Salmonella enterica subsp. enterica]EDR2770444.1 hypothetical protein [Salmonella enterica subsp. enterica serovar Oslo]EEC4247236.1 hypothetical protein [Salmonella enterica subsp. diarizonae]EEM2500692.1 hypothetical protein [Salmonella enterica subsp. ind
MINYDALHINVALAHCRNVINRVKLKHNLIFLH